MCAIHSAMFKTYDVIVVGAGHAGCEAAHAAAKMGSSVLLITMNMNTIAQMSCNPAMGGVAKGQIVREIDALGGLSGIVTDETMIQFRLLNRSKGPAMWSPRAQSDRALFSTKWREMLEQTANVDFWQEMVKELIVEGDVVKGVRTGLGIEMHSKTVILTNGTFLNGLIHIGEKTFGGGRAAEKASVGLTEQLEQLGFESGRMKTGTPARVDGRSLNYDKMELQPGDEDVTGFSFLKKPELKKQRPCHVTYTNPRVHEILKTGFEKSPLFNGRIKGMGPRYCPSVEDKVSRFADKDRHQIFVEPEGWNTVEIYVNGFSSSLPEDVQYKAMIEIPGFENAKMFRPGYAIEYDFFQPVQLKPNLETKRIHNLFFAGQINGTTGYEEAGSQGLMAGINAHLLINEQDPFILKRSDAYIGVLIDDLINKGTDEPYRMFTSRAEYRILMRQDNADVRLTVKGYQLGLAEENRLNILRNKKSSIETITAYLNETSVTPAAIEQYLNDAGTHPLKQQVKLNTVIARPQVNIQDLRKNMTSLDEFLNKHSDEAISCAEINLKYTGYIQREKEMVQKMNRLEYIKLNPNLNYSEINSLSSEAREKLDKIKPINLGQASRISGVSPADISVLMVYVGR